LKNYHMKNYMKFMKTEKRYKNGVIPIWVDKEIE